MFASQHACMQEAATEKARLTAALTELEGRMTNGQQQYAQQAGAQIVSTQAHVARNAFLQAQWPTTQA